MSEAVIRFGEVDLTTCDREPIHIPGSIQPHGVLLVLDRRRQWVEQTAGNTAALLGFAAPELLGLSVGDILDPAAGAFVRRLLETPPAHIAPVVRLGVGSRRAAGTLDITVHADAGTAIIEVELARHALTGIGDPIVQLKTLLAAVQHTASLQECCDAAAVAMRSATGFDRAMVYRFLPDGSGVVTAEDARAGLESFLGLHYPASDIPQQARELYRRNWLRAIANVDYVPAPLYPEINPRTHSPLDMSHCDLRSVSPIHLEYLRNMGVGASLSASIICRSELWGMLVLHHYSPKHVPADMRVTCETFAQTLSLHVEAKVQSENALERSGKRRTCDLIVARLTVATDIGAALAAPDLPPYLGAVGAAVYLDGRLHRVGSTPDAAAILALVDWLNGINRPLFASAGLADDYPPGAALAAQASGLVAIALSRAPRDYVIWFRPEMSSTVRWAGDPNKPIKADRHGARLTPRGSFAEWQEVSRLHCAPWSDVDLEAAEALRIVLLESVLKSVDLQRREREVAQTRIMAEELEKRVAQRTEQLRAVAADLEAVEERERRQIARDLHDDLGQILAAARIRLASLVEHSDSEVARAAAGVDAMIERANSAIRSLAAQLAPDVLHELGLLPALEWLGEEMERTFDIQVTLRDDSRPKLLSSAARSILYRAVRELLINVAKHAQSDTASVEVACEAGHIVVTVSDPGVGFDVEAVPGERRGLGLIGVRERLSYIGGTAHWRSQPGRGTRVVLTSPLLRDDPEPARSLRQ